jgi:hypothetical protein
VSGFATLLLVAALALQPVREVRQGRFTWHFAPDREAAVAPLIDEGEATLLRLAAELNVPAPDAVTVDVADTLDEFRDLQDVPEGRVAIDWAVGLADAEAGRILLRVDRTHLFTLDETFRHELSHLVLLGGLSRREFPRWFSEGVAILQSGEALVNRLDPALNAAASGRLLPISALTRSFPPEGPALHLAYAQSAFLVRWMLRQHGYERLRELVRDTRRFGDFERHLVRLYGGSSEGLFNAWRLELERDASWWRVLSTDWMIWSGVTLLFLVAVTVKWVRTRRRLRQWDEEEERPWVGRA